MGKIKACLLVQPYKECYEQEKQDINNANALKILQYIKIMCLDVFTEENGVDQPPEV